MVKLAMPTEDTHKDPCEQNLNLLQTMIANDYAALIEARSTQGEVDRIKSREMTLLEVSELLFVRVSECIAHTDRNLKAAVHLEHNIT